jgi:type I restriction enzyme S subunit
MPADRRDMSWRATTIGALIEAHVLEVGDGYRAKNDELGGDGLIFLRSGHVADDRIEFSGTERFRTTDRGTFGNKVSRSGDVIVTTKGWSTGRVGFVNDSMPSFVYSPHLSYWRVLDSTQICSAYLRQWSRSPECQRQVASIRMSIDIHPYLSLATQRRLKITLPPFDTQRSIANVLGALDDKIELNRRMNETLERMARALFKSWFVDFDPVREIEGRAPVGMDAPTATLFPSSMIESHGTEVPAEWRLGRFDEVVECPRRGVQPSEIDPETPYLGLEHMPRRSIALAEWGVAADVTSGKFQFKRSEILFGKLRPYFHKVGLAPLDGVCSTDILVLVARYPSHGPFALFHASSDELIQFVDAASTGTKMPRASWADIGRFPIVVPPDGVAAAFKQITAPMLDRILLNIHEAKTLAATRDLLLPKLLSGGLRVRDAEKMM